jgi:hypothetical protein
MVSVWVAVLGIVGTLAAAVLTQILTNRREFQRDQLRWGQERQQRELDSQKVALSTALTALHKWHSGLTAVNLYLGDQYERKADMTGVAELELEARHAYAEVRLLCSAAAVKATVTAIDHLDQMNYKLRVAVERFQNEPGGHESSIKTRLHDSAMDYVAKAYRDELAKLNAEPVLLPRSARNWLRLPWRKAG